MKEVIKPTLGPTQQRVIAIVLALLVSLEFGLRLIGERLSGNLATVARIPEVMTQAGHPQERTLLLLGNSLVGTGVDPSVLKAALPQFSIAKVSPDGTGLWDWRCLLEHQVLERADVQFDMIVVGFAWHLLSDQTRSDPSRLGSLYCGLQDLATPRDIGLDSIGDEAEFLLAHTLRVYAMRETVRNRLMSTFVPHYQKFTQTANGSRAKSEGTSPELPTSTYTHFESLLAQLRAKGARVVIVAMPVPSGYELDPPLLRLAEKHEIDLIDLRHVRGIGPGSYTDSMHLNGKGQRVVSRVLADALGSEIKTR
jgi:hypothetical protein